MIRTKNSLFLILGFLTGQAMLPGATTGSISGTLTDASGGVIPHAKLVALNPATGIQNKTTSDDKGFYVFPSLPVGGYDLKVEARGFKPQTRPALMIDLDSALQVDVVMEVAEKAEEVTISDTANDVQVETV